MASESLIVFYSSETATCPKAHSKFSIRPVLEARPPDPKAMYVDDRVTYTSALG